MGMKSADLKSADHDPPTILPSIVTKMIIHDFAIFVIL